MRSGFHLWTETLSNIKALRWDMKLRNKNFKGSGERHGWKYKQNLITGIFFSRLLVFFLPSFFKHVYVKPDVQKKKKKVEKEAKTGTGEYVLRIKKKKKRKKT